MDDEKIIDYAAIIKQLIKKLLIKVGISNHSIDNVTIILLIFISIIIVYSLQFIVRNLLLLFFEKVEKITKIKFFGYLIKNRVPHFLALVVPFSFIKTAIPIILSGYRFWSKPLLRLLDIYLVFMVVWTFMAILRSLVDVLREKDQFKRKPFDSYLQIIQIILYIFGCIVIYSIITGKSPAGFFAAMGAASAVLMLVFKDTIMGFVASIQLSSNDMLQIGDWITMDKYGADGNVEEINLTSVKVRNFDNTITTIPTYALISDSFQNWRGMQQAGLRRFLRNITIKQSTIHYLDKESLEKFKNIKGITSFIDNKLKEYELFNQSIHADLEASPLNGMQLTNLSLFLEYAVWFLRKHPKIDENQTLLVRPRIAEVSGIPIQVYAFTKTTQLDEYEDIISEVMAHLISSVDYFDLVIFEKITGTDYLNYPSST